MLGCIQPTSSPMMNMMLGFCCAAAGSTVTATPAVSAMSTAMAFRKCFMPCLLPDARLRDRSLQLLQRHALQRHVRRVHAVLRALAQTVGTGGGLDNSGNHGGAP